MIDIKELRRLAAAATPGPWQDGGHTVYEAEGNVNCPEMICKMMSIEDSAYIAASNPSAILSLLDHIEQQEAEIARLRKDAWQPIDTVPKDGNEFQAWVNGCWEPRCLFNTIKENFEIFGRIDYDIDGWEFCIEPSHWKPQPIAPDTSTQEVG